MWTYWALAFLCVVGISVGQVLFKSAAISFEAAQSIFVLRPMLVLFAALVLYAVTTVGWVFVLSKLARESLPFDGTCFRIRSVLVGIRF